MVTKRRSNDIIPMEVKINPQKKIQRLKVLVVQLKTEKIDNKAAMEEPRVQRTDHDEELRQEVGRWRREKTT